MNSKYHLLHRSLAMMFMLAFSFIAAGCPYIPLYLENPKLADLSKNSAQHNSYLPTMCNDSIFSLSVAAEFNYANTVMEALSEEINTRGYRVESTNTIWSILGVVAGSFLAVYTAAIPSASETERKIVTISLSLFSTGSLSLPQLPELAGTARIKLLRRRYDDLLEAKGKAVRELAEITCTGGNNVDIAKVKTFRQTLAAWHDLCLKPLESDKK